MRPLPNLGQRAPLLTKQDRDLRTPPLGHVAQLVVPHHLDATLRYREWHSGADSLLQAPAIAANTRLAGIRLGALSHFGRNRTAAVRGIDIQAVTRIGLDQRDLPFRQRILVLGHIARVDRVQRLFTGIWISFPSRPSSRGLNQAATPGGDAPIGITGLLCPNRG